MRVEFVRVGDRHCKVRVFRNDGAVLETISPAKGALPHDLEHFVVENAVGLESGLWGRIAAGAEFRSFTVARDKPRRRSRAVNRALTRGMSGWDEHIIGVVDRLFEAARARGWRPPAPLPPGLPVEKELANAASMMGRAFAPADVERACVDLYEAAAAWVVLADGESLARTWTAQPFASSTSALRRRRR